MKKRIKIAVVGSASLSRKDAAMLATAILSNLATRYSVTTLITIEEDPLGVALRSISHAPQHTYSESRHADQHYADELAAADVFWSTTNYILIDNGELSYAHHLATMLDRHRRRYKLLEVQ